MKFVPSINEIKEGHDKFVSKSGDPAEMIAEANLAYAHYNANRTQDPFKAAARLLYGIITGHPFYEGNKRTGWASSNLIMENAGFTLRASDEETIEFVKDIASYKLKLEEVEGWIVDNYR